MTTRTCRSGTSVYMVSPANKTAAQNMSATPVRHEFGLEFHAAAEPAKTPLAVQQMATGKLNAPIEPPKSKLERNVQLAAVSPPTTINAT